MSIPDHYLLCLQHMNQTGWAGFDRMTVSQSLNLPLENTPSREQLLTAFQRHVTDTLKQTLKFEELRAASIRDRLMEIILCRLELIEPYKASFIRLFEDLKNDRCLLFEFIIQRPFPLDWSWAFLEDSPDIKTLLAPQILSLCYGVTFLYWLQDSTPDMSKTMAFLDRILSWEGWRFLP